MTEYTYLPLQDAAVVRLPGVRKQALGWVVMSGSRALAAFESEGRARAYAQRLNKLMRAPA